VNERQWLASVNAETMLKHLGGMASARKLRLFICTCCRRVPALMESARIRAAVEAAENFADGLAPNQERSYQETEVRIVRALLPFRAAYLARRCLWRCRNRADANRVASWAAQDLAICLAEDPAPNKAFRRVPCDILREVFGNPFRPPTLPKRLPAHLTALARSVYDGGNDRFALHDALLDAGLDELAHFKSNWHPKGCWALDAILKKK
jgi:hypothetical protein